MKGDPAVVFFWAMISGVLIFVNVGLWVARHAS
jgi:hypothetical protein